MYTEQDIQLTVADKVSDILVVNGLDFEIKKLPLTAPNGNHTVLTDYFGLLNSKSGNIINTVKKGYTVTQNAEIVEAVVRGSEKFGELSVNQAWSINDGRKIMIQLAIKGDAKVGNDTIKRNITIIDSNDGSSGLSVGIGDLTVSCQNQFFMFAKSGQFKFRHTMTVAEKVKMLPTLIENALSESMRLMERYREFQSTKVSRELAHKMVNHILGFDRTSSVKELAELSTRNENAMNSLYDNIENEMNSKGDNLWGLHSGVTRWTTHVKSAPRRENGRLESIAMGTNYRTNQKSFEFVTEALMA
jgi:hypothetical protein